MPGIICAVLILSVARLSLTKGNSSTDGAQYSTAASPYTTSHNETSPADRATDSGGQWWEEFLTMNHGIAFAAGASLSAIVCCACFCAIGSCARRKWRKQRDRDKDVSGAALMPMLTVNQQLSGSKGFGDYDQMALQTTSGEPGAGVTGDVYYATIDISQLKKRDAMEGQERGVNSDYAEICKKENSRKYQGGEEEGEGEGEAEEDAENFGGV